VQFYSAKTKQEILPFTTTWMELEGNMHSEITQAQKDRYQMISLTSQKEKQEKLSEQNSTRFIEAKNGLTFTKGKETGVDSWDWTDKGRGKESVHCD